MGLGSALEGEQGYRPGRTYKLEVTFHNSPFKDLPLCLHWKVDNSTLDL